MSRARRRYVQDINSPQLAARRLYTYSPVAEPPSPAAKRKSRAKPKKDLWLVRLLVVLAVCSGLLLKTVDLKPTQAKNEADSQTFPKQLRVTAAKQVKGVNTDSITNQLNSIIQSHPGLEISISYTDLKTATNLHVGVQEPYNAASTAKLVTAITYLHQVETGQRTLTQSVGGSPAQSQLQVMIEKSDNPSWLAFDRLMGSSALEQYAKQIGLQNFKHNKNTTTSSDIALLLGKLYEGKLLNPSHTQLLLSYMQNASEAQYIPAAVPQGVKVYHKAGYLEDRAHDAAIVDNNERPFVLVIFTKSDGAYDFTLGKKIMHDITNVVLVEQQKL